MEISKSHTPRGLDYVCGVDGAATVGQLSLRMMLSIVEELGDGGLALWTVYLQELLCD